MFYLFIILNFIVFYLELEARVEKQEKFKERVTLPQFQRHLYMYMKETHGDNFKVSGKLFLFLPEKNYYSENSSFAILYKIKLYICLCQDRFFIILISRYN